jgi:hypothetical protein
MVVAPTSAASEGAGDACRVTSPPLPHPALVAGLLTLVAWTFSAGLGAGFVYDDRADVIANAAATPDGFFAALGTTNRPLLKATYAAQRALFDAGPLSFHTVNLALHLATTLLVWSLLRRVLGRCATPAADAVAAFASAVWAVHPATVETVVPVTGRSVGLPSFPGPPGRQSCTSPCWPRPRSPFPSSDAGRRRRPSPAAGR